MQALPLIFAGGSSLLSMSQQQRAGAASASEGELLAQQYELEADAEEMAAVQRESDRKTDLARAMASQTASAGARGISAFEGSPLTILEADIAEEETATERDLFNTELAAMTKRLQGQVARRRGLLQQSLGQQGAIAGFGQDFLQIAQET